LSEPGFDDATADIGITGICGSGIIEVIAEMFLALVGEPPAAYLRRWRLTLARQDAARGDRVDAIARRYGYVSPEGFTRAFKKHFGQSPVTLRP